MIIWERITNISIKFETVAVSNTKRVLSKTNANSRASSSGIFRTLQFQASFVRLLLQPASIPYVTPLLHYVCKKIFPYDAEAIAAVWTITFASDLGFSTIIAEPAQ